MARATLAARREAGGGLVLVGLDVDRDSAPTYTTPGQYVEVKTERGNGYFVLAGDVRESRWELLVRNAGDAADALVSSELGSAFDVSSALGSGFPIAHAGGRHVVVAAVGTAMAVARPILRQRIADGDAKRTHVFLGVRTPVDVPLSSEVDAWSEGGAHVVLCLSQEEDHAHAKLVPHASRAVGYVQRAVERALELGEIPHGALVVAAGPKAMLAEMRTLAGQRPGSVEVVTNV